MDINDLNTDIKVLEAHLDGFISLVSVEIKQLQDSNEKFHTELTEIRSRMDTSQGTVGITAKVILAASLFLSFISVSIIIFHAIAG